MKIDVACPDCGTKYRVGEEHAGKKIRCKQCSSIVAIPAAESPPDDEFGSEFDDLSWDSPPAASGSRGGGLPPRVRKKAPPQPKPKAAASKKPRRESSGETNHQLVLALVAAAAFIGLLIGGFFKHEVALWGAIGLLGVGNLMSYFHAAQNDCGFLYRIIPFYSVYYTFANLGELWHWGVMRIGGGVLLIAAVVFHVREGGPRLNFADLDLPTKHSLTVSTWDPNLPDDADDDPTYREEEFNAPSEQTIRTQIASLAWDDPQRACHVYLRSPAGSDQVMNTLAMMNGAALNEPAAPLRIEWNRFNLEDLDEYKQSPPLASADEAIPVFTALAQGDPNWHAAIQWEDVTK